LDNLGVDPIIIGLFIIMIRLERFGILPKEVDDRRRKHLNVTVLVFFLSLGSSTVEHAYNRLERIII